MFFIFNSSRNLDNHQPSQNYKELKLSCRNHLNHLYKRYRNTSPARRGNNLLFGEPKRPPSPLFRIRPLLMDSEERARYELIHRI